MAIKGHETEKFLRDMHEVYRKQGRALLRKTGPETYRRWDSKLNRKILGEKRGPVDFEGIILLEGIGRYVCFDAKQTQRARRMSLHKDHVPEHQKAYLISKSDFGGVAFLYVSQKIDAVVTNFLYPVIKGQGSVLFGKSIPFTDMIKLPDSGDWLDWVVENVWMWDV